MTTPERTTEERGLAAKRAERPERIPVEEKGWTDLLEKTGAEIARIRNL